AGVTGSCQDDPLRAERRGTVDAPRLDVLLGMDFFVGLPVVDGPVLDGEGPDGEGPDGEGPEGEGREGGPVAWVAAPVDDFDRVLAGATDALSTDLGASLTVDLIGPAGDSTDTVSRVAERSGTAGPRSSARHEV